jgi:hypothetical protein
MEPGESGEDQMMRDPPEAADQLKRENYVNRSYKGMDMNLLDEQFERESFKGKNGAS